MDSGSEDLIVSKLTYYIGNRDVRDVLSILRNSYSEINWLRLFRSAREFGVENKIKAILEELGRGK